MKTDGYVAKGSCYFGHPLKMSAWYPLGRVHKFSTCPRVFSTFVLIRQVFGELLRRGSSQIEVISLRFFFFWATHLIAAAIACHCFAQCMLVGVYHSCMYIHVWIYTKKPYKSPIAIPH